MKNQNVFKQQLEALRYVPSTNNVKKFSCKNTCTLLRIEVNLYYTLRFISFLKRNKIFRIKKTDL